MKILFCVEFYYPSIGGAQEVVRQIAERMASYGHDVSVATTRLATRRSSNHNGVALVEFSVWGNNVRGLRGEVDRYREFLSKSKFDVVMFYAAQQWTFDAAWPIMPLISACKVMVPCGYSNLFETAYKTYFDELPAVLKHMDAIVYHAKTYRDVEFGKLHRIGKEIFIPNGADAVEFSVAKDTDFLRSISADASTLVLLTVGTMTGMKGHLELAQAFEKIDFGGRKSVLILNGNNNEIGGQRSAMPGLFFALLREYGLRYAFRHCVKIFLRRCGLHIGKAIKTVSVQDCADRINREQGKTKRVIVVDFPRDQLVQAYLNADLFVFASNIEYSPLVLFEACAAGLAFLSVPVGNAAEIAAWTGGGEICEAPVDERGYTRVSPEVLRRRIEEIAGDADKLVQLGQNGLIAARERYNWDAIARTYENLFDRLVGVSRCHSAGRAVQV
jgi:glycosyltransferase involved in cell wall biosynthesis